MSHKSLASLPSSRSVSFSAFRAGSLQGVLLRSSGHSQSGVVLVCHFSCPVRAGQFAARWAGRLGFSVRLRPWAGFWSVSVPVSVGSTRLPRSIGRMVWLAGGVLSVRQSLLSAGLAF